MAAATISPHPDEERAPEPTEAQEQLFSEALAGKLEQGYHLESRNKTDAVIFSKGRRRWFGLVAGPPGRRRRISLNEDGGVKTRGL